MKLLKNTIIMPLEGTMDSFTGGIFSSDGEFIDDSIVDRGNKPQLQKQIESLSGAYIYGGCLFGHFGHFIWESLSRLYTIRQCKNHPIVFITPNDKIHNAHKLFFKTIGIKNEIYIVKMPTHIDNLIYSSPGSSINPLYITDDQCNSLKYFSFPGGGEHREKIWLSRSKLKSGKVINEVYIETELQKIGFTIIHPEALPLREQVRLISNSDIVAGFDGSQFFSLLFAKEFQSKFVIFNRRENIPRTLSYMFEKRNVAFNMHTLNLEYIDGERASANFLSLEQNTIISILSESL